MLTYLLMLALISIGANFFAITIVRNLLSDRRVSVYDGRGYLLLVVVLISFALACLAYFWAEIRFSSTLGSIDESLIGVFFSLSCNLFCLLYGFVRLRDSLKPE